MMATFTIEALLALWVIGRYGWTKAHRIIVLILIGLGTFQLAEYLICKDQPMIFWSKIGYAAITLLPALGVHLVANATKQYRWVKIGYLLAAIFALSYTLFPNAITGSICGGNYVIFTTSPSLSHLYSIYYNLLLFMGVFEALVALQKSDNKHKQNLFKWLIFGYLTFIVPTIVIYGVLPLTQTGAPSIMCGFALILAFILALPIASLVNRSS